MSSQEPTVPSERLKNLMSLAVEAAGWVRLKIPNSGNYEATSSPVYKSNYDPLTKPSSESKDSVVDRKDASESKEAKNPFPEYKNYKVNKVKQADVNILRDEIRAKFPKGAWTDQNFLAVGKMVTDMCVAKKMGNCGELAYAAVHHLYGMGVRDIDYVEVGCTGQVTNTKVLDHEFVVLGRAGGPVLNGADIGAPSTWGTDAVICDPWDRSVYPATMFARFSAGMTNACTGNLTFTLVHRFR